MLFLKNRFLIGLFVALSATYLFLTILLPADKNALHKYHISAIELIAISLAIALPYIIIWFIALIGYLRFRSYTSTIRSSKDGEAFHTMSIGILFLAVWLPISAIIGSITTGVQVAHPSIKPLMVILVNYINLILLFPVFYYIYHGSKKALIAIRKREERLPHSISITFIILSSLYLLLVIHDPNRQHTVQGVSTAAYYLPDWLIVITVIIPRLILWFLGLQTIYNIYLYRKGVKGAIYKNALKDLANGLSGIIIVIIVLRCFESFTSLLNKLNLGLILIIVYLLLIALAAAFIKISKGAKRLQRIEDI